MSTYKMNADAQEVISLFSENAADDGFVPFNYEKMMHRVSKRDQLEFHAAQKKIMERNNVGYMRLIF